jgi:hypothetical protein
VFKITQATKTKVGQIKDGVVLTLGTLDEKPCQDDEARKNETQYDVIQREYDYSVGPVLKQVK